ncbi:MAG: hypothetical protein Q8L05_05645, partial [Actinomycetota bacterium]|nr:hypothetical protein [Actinomycetota bacterium]
MSVSRLLIPAVCLWLSALACELLVTSREFDGEQFARLSLALALLTLTLAAFAGWRFRTWRSSRILAVVVGAAIGVLA